MQANILDLGNIYNRLSRQRLLTDPLAGEIIAQQANEHRHELDRHNHIANVFLRAAGGDPVQAERYLDNVIDTLHEVGVLSTWKYRALLGKIRKGFSDE